MEQVLPLYKPGGFNLMKRIIDKSFEDKGDLMPKRKESTNSSKKKQTASKRLSGGKERRSKSLVGTEQRPSIEKARRESKRMSLTGE